MKPPTGKYNSTTHPCEGGMWEWLDGKPNGTDSTVGRCRGCGGVVKKTSAGFGRGDWFWEAEPPPPTTLELLQELGIV